MAEIVTDPEVRSGSPRIEGTRITVLDVKRRVIDSGEDPHVVAGEYDVSMAALFRALAHYYENRDAFERREREDAARRREAERRSRDSLERVERGERETGEHAD